MKSRIPKPPISLKILYVHWHEWTCTMKRQFLKRKSIFVQNNETISVVRTFVNIQSHITHYLKCSNIQKLPNLCTYARKFQREQIQYFCLGCKNFSAQLYVILTRSISSKNRFSSNNTVWTKVIFSTSPSLTLTLKNSWANIGSSLISRSSLPSSLFSAVVSV